MNVEVSDIEISFFFAPKDMHRINQVCAMPYTAYAAPDHAMTRSNWWARLRSMQTIKPQTTASMFASGAPSAKIGSLRAIDTEGAIGLRRIRPTSRHNGSGDAIQGCTASCSCKTKTYARTTIATKPSSGACSLRSPRVDAAKTPSPRTMHQNAIAAGELEPKGKGAKATVAKRMNDEILFDVSRAKGVMSIQSL